MAQGKVISVATTGAVTTFNPDVILVDNYMDVLVDNEGNVIVEG